MVFDFSGKPQNVNDVGQMVDGLSPKLAEEVKQFIMEIRHKDEEQAERRYKDWVKSSVIDGLKCFAEMTMSILEIEEYEAEVDVLLKNTDGFNTQNESALQSLKVSITAADYVSIEAKNGMIQVNLVYDLAKGSQDKRTEDVSFD